ncbi:DUF4347 domain-containing protein, partial [Cysteiniphilum litorale]|uniref:DUF4347 domain-containing protein n=1 Tax=Cysteiniphilum litorale TaxID=2056700 RepID=UPI003F8848BB
MFKKVYTAVIASFSKLHTNGGDTDAENAKLQSQPLLLQELEPRIMFDGAFVASVDTIDEPSNIAFDMPAWQADKSNDIENDFGLSYVESNYHAIKEVIIIDASIEDPHTILQNIQREAAIEIILEHQDGIEEITKLLEKYSQLEAMHIISHGAIGELQLGISRLNNETLDQYQPQLSRWGQALRESGDILFYGCDVASGNEGKAFVDRLELRIKKDIAASDDATGSIANADAILEYGDDIEAKTLNVFNDYSFTLAETGVTEMGMLIGGSSESNTSGTSVATSANGKTVIIGEPDAETTGVAKVYTWDGEKWQQKGRALEGEAISGFGYDVAINQMGDRVAVSSANNNLVVVYQWSDTKQSWEQLGNKISAATDHYFGAAISFNSTGNILAVGATQATSSQEGYVKVYRLMDNASWDQLGVSIKLNTNFALVGTDLDLSDDGQVISILSPVEKENGQARVFIYTWNQVDRIWQAKGSVIQAESVASSNTVTMSGDSDTIALVEAWYSPPDLNMNIKVAVYVWNGSDWQKQTSLPDTAIQGSTYKQVSIDFDNSGSRIAVGYINTVGNATVKVYDLNNSSYTLFASINGDTKAVKNHFVDLSDNGAVLAVAGVFKNQDNKNSTRLYQLNNQASGDIRYTLSNTGLLQFNYIKYDKELSVINDMDGFDANNLIFTWYADGVQITGALLERSGVGSNPDVLWLTDQYYVGKHITLNVSFIDNLGNQEKLSVTTDNTVENQNDVVSGRVIVNGEPIYGRELSVSLDEVIDADGYDKQLVQYQWYRNGFAIDGEKDAEYLLTKSDISTYVSVLVAFTDNYGSDEMLSSESILVSNIPNTPAQGEVKIGVKVVNVEDVEDYDYLPVNNSAIYEEDTYSVDVSDITDADGVG